MHLQGDYLQALTAIEQGLTLAHHWTAAVETYKTAIAAYTKIGNRKVAAEAQAGLAQIALAQGDLAGAQAQIEALLPALADQPHAGYNNPFFIYLTAYRVLAAGGDRRAALLVAQGHDLLQQVATPLDEESRRRFFAVPLHRDLMAAYHAQPAPQ